MFSEIFNSRFVENEMTNICQKKHDKNLATDSELLMVRFLVHLKHKLSRQGQEYTTHFLFLVTSNLLW
jgi:hypothetical protein